DLGTEKAKRMMDAVRRFGHRLFVLTGGDPLTRRDIVELVAYGASIGLRVAMTTSGTPLMTESVLRDLRDAGLARLAVSLDGSTAAIHDARSEEHTSELQSRENPVCRLLLEK